MEKEDQPVYCERKTVEEAENERKLLTQKSLFDLGRTAAKEEIEKDRKVEVDEYFDEFVSGYDLEEETMELVYATPSLLMDMLLEKECEKIESLNWIKGKPAKKEFMKMMIAMDILKKRLEKKEEELVLMQEERDEYEEQVDGYIDDLEDLEKRLQERDQQIKVCMEMINEMDINKSKIQRMEFFYNICLLVQIVMLGFFGWGFIKRE